MKTINLENIKTPQDIIDAFNILNEKAIKIGTPNLSEYRNIYFY